MKNKMTLVMALFLLVSLPFNQSCKKDEMQPRFPSYIFFEQGSDYMLKKMIPGVDAERSKDRPLSFDSLKKVYYDGFVAIWNEHIIAELDKFTGMVNTDFRDKPTDRWAWLERRKNWTAEDAYDHQDAGFDPRFFELCEGALDALHKEIYDYVLTDVNGQWSSGESKQADRDAILHFLDKVDPENKWEMTYGQQFESAINNYIKTGKFPVHHSKHRNGWWFARSKRWSLLD